MKAFVELINMMPRAVQLTIAGILFGGLAFAGHEIRYMTVADFTKSYVLDLKGAIRETRKDLRDPELPDQVREILIENLAAMIDELCYELPSDRECKDREPSE